MTPEEAIKWLDEVGDMHEYCLIGSKLMTVAKIIESQHAEIERLKPLAELGGN